MCDSLYKTKRSMDGNLVATINTLFGMLIDSVPTRVAYGFGEGGVIYNFFYLSENGIKCGETWSPENKSLLGDVIQICDSLMLYAQGRCVDLRALQDSINLICKRIE